MDFKLVRLLLPVFLAFGVVYSQENGIEIDRGEVAGKCAGKGVGEFVSLNADCRTYSQCSGIYHRILPTMFYCAPGTLFSEEIGRCDFAQNVICPVGSDPCAGLSDGYREDTARGEENKGAVLMCENDRTIGGSFCRLCERYGDSETGCVAIAGCTANEPDFACNLRRNDDNDRTYFAMEPGRVDTLMTCPNTTIYDEAICGCA